MQGFELIDSYTRAQAIEDGVLFAVSPWKLARCGFLYPVAYTASIRAMLTERGTRTIRIMGNEDDLLLLLHEAIKRADEGDTLLFGIMTIEDGEIAETTIKALVGPGDEGEPVITLMLENED